MTPVSRFHPTHYCWSSSAVFTHAGESERQADNLSDTGVHKGVVRNKQADVSNEAGGFEHSEGIWVIPSDETLTGWEGYPVRPWTQMKVIMGTGRLEYVRGFVLWPWRCCPYKLG